MMGSIFRFYSNFNRKFCKQAVKILIQMPYSAESDVGLHSLPLFHKKMPGLYGLKVNFIFEKSCFLYPYFLTRGCHPSIFYNSLCQKF